MQQIISQYFDFGVMFDPDNFDKVLKGFWYTVKLSVISGVLALTYQLAATTLTKVGETDLAWIAADRGLNAATASNDPLVLISVYRAVAHALLSNGRYEEAAEANRKGAAADLA